MRFVFILSFFLLGSVLSAQDWEEQQRFGSRDAQSVLRILSSTDIELFAPVLEAFLRTRDTVAIDYFVSGTATIDAVFREDPSSFDIVISSAMDLQFKLANDGFALAMTDLSHPDWAHWRQSLFAFTSEPAAIVINKNAFPDGDIPGTRQALIRALRDRPDVFSGRVGTYDVRQSGLGYLFATQDARTSETYWRLMEVMGNLDARIYCCSGEMIEDVASGRLALAYNVLGSYAAARSDLSDQIEIVIPSDFQTIMMRTALVSQQTKLPDIAQAFVAHLATRPSVTPSLPMLDLESDATEQSTIQLSPALLTYLDALKSRGFLTEWSDAIIQ